MRATLTRIQRDDKQTLGYIDIYNGVERVFTCKTLELPYRKNQTNISCIPEGVYLCELFTSPSKGEVYKLRYVVDRTFIEIHAGNFNYDILGCILVGDNFIDINKDGCLDVTNSRHTLDALKKATNKKSFYLTIVNQY